MIPAAPRLTDSLTELPRATRETCALFINMSRLIRNAPAGTGQPILTLPGYGGADGSMAAMRYFLNKIGYQAFALNLGRNVEAVQDRIRSVDDATAFRNKMVSMIGQRIDQLYARTGQAITLIGWSMGGCYALDVSQIKSRQVKQVITLGSPFGDPRGTSTWDLMRWINQSDIPPEKMDFAAWLDKRIVKTRHIPIHVIYSPRDGIVGEAVAKLPRHPSVTHSAIDSSHVSFAFNSEAFKKIAEVLGKL